MSHDSTHTAPQYSPYFSVCYLLKVKSVPRDASTDVLILQERNHHGNVYHTLTLVYCGPNGVLTIAVPLYRTVCCGPNGVLIIEVPLYRTVYCGPNGVLTIEVPLYRTVCCGPNGVLIIEVPLYRTVYSGPNGVLIVEVPLYRTVYRGPNGVLTIEVYLIPYSQKGWWGIHLWIGGFHILQIVIRQI